MEKDSMEDSKKKVAEQQFIILIKNIIFYNFPMF